MARRMWAWAGVVVLLAVGMYRFAAGDRLSPLSAAAVVVGSKFQEFGVVRYRWGEVLLLQTPEGPRTEMVARQGLLWRDTANAIFPFKHRGPIQTVAWMSANLPRGATTVIAVRVSDPAIAYVAAGPPSMRRTRPVAVGKPLIVTWNQSLFPFQVNLTALSKSGRPLYRYAAQEHRTLSGGIVATGLYQWYPIHSHR